MLELILNKNLKYLFKKTGFDWSCLDTELKRLDEVCQ